MDRYFLTPHNYRDVSGFFKITEHSIFCLPRWRKQSSGKLFAFDLRNEPITSTCDGLATRRVRVTEGLALHPLLWLFLQPKSHSLIHSSTTTPIAYRSRSQISPTIRRAYQNCRLDYPEVRVINLRHWFGLFLIVRGPIISSSIDLHGVSTK